VLSKRPSVRKRKNGKRNDQRPFEKKKLEIRTGVSKKSSTTAPATITVRKMDKTMPLNKYVAHCGICSRRDAVPLIKDGKMKVNDVVIVEPGFKVAPNDVVLFNGKKIYPEKNLVYNSIE